MIMTALSGALQGLTRLTPADLGRFKAAVMAGKKTGWAYCFLYLACRVKPGRTDILLTEDEGSLCIFESSVPEGMPRLDLVFPPLPMNSAVLARCMERANDFNGDRSARVKRIDEQDAAAVSALPALRVKQRRLQYLYAPAQFEQLAGRKLETVRRNVAAVQRLSEVAIEPLRAEHVEGCRNLLAVWQQHHEATQGTAGGTGVTRRALALVGTLAEPDLRGEVVVINGRIAGFALAGEIRPGLACSFERKCDTAVRGLSYFQFRSLLLRLRDCERVNDGSDAGRAGLRQLKDSFRPVAMHSEFRASQGRPA